MSNRSRSKASKDDKAVKTLRVAKLRIKYNLAHNESALETLKCTESLGMLQDKVLVCHEKEKGQIVEIMQNVPFTC